MKAETNKTHPNEPVFRLRVIQLAVAAPSFLLWSLLTGIALLWYVGVGIRAISGSLSVVDGRFLYLIVMLFLLLASSCVTARTLWRAYQGRSPLWWHCCTFCAGIVFLGLIGIVGD